MVSIIEDVQVRKILDSRGNPTIEVDVITWNSSGRAAAPSGASTGSREVVSYPKGGIDEVVSEMEDLIASELIGMDADDLATIDEVLREVDGTDNLSAIGGNTTVAISMAVAKAAAASYNMPLYKYIGGNLVNELPFPLGNMMNGGAHAGINVPDIQELPAESAPLLSRLDALAMDGLRYRPHRTHFCVDDTVAAMRQLQPRRGYITHVGHEVEYAALCDYLPENMEAAYDGMLLELR